MSKYDQATYLGPLTFWGFVNKVELHDLLTAPNTGTNLGRIAITQLCLQKESKGATLPDATFEAKRIGRELKQINSSITLPKLDDLEEQFEIEDKINVRGILGGVSLTDLNLKPGIEFNPDGFLYSHELSGQYTFDRDRLMVQLEFAHWNMSDAEEQY